MIIPPHKLVCTNIWGSDTDGAISKMSSASVTCGGCRTECRLMVTWCCKSTKIVKNLSIHCTLRQRSKRISHTDLVQLTLNFHTNPINCSVHVARLIQINARKAAKFALTVAEFKYRIHLI